MHYTIKKRTDSEVIASGVADDTAQDFEGNWYFAPEAVNMQYLKVTNRTYTCPYKGTCFWIDFEAPDVHATNIAWVYQNPKPGYEFIKDQIGFYVRNTSATVAAREPN
jgi:uncharacterized protein (DUF427 family)